MTFNILKNNRITTSKELPMNRVLVVAGGSLVALILLGSIGLLYINYALHAPLDPNAGEQIFVVAKGETARQVARNLETQGLIRDDLLFLLYLRTLNLHQTLHQTNTKPSFISACPEGCRCAPNRAPLWFWGRLSFGESSVRGEQSEPRSPTHHLSEKVVRGSSVGIGEEPRKPGRRSSASIKAGKYLLSPAMTIPEIAAKLTAGDIWSEEIKVTIPEGFNVFEIDSRLAESGLIKQGELLEFARQHMMVTKQTQNLNTKQPPNSFVPALNRAEGSGLGLVSCSEAEPSPVSCGLVSTLEGYLFPDTYKFKKGASVEAIVTKMLANFQRKITKQTQNLNTKPTQNGLVPVSCEEVSTSSVSCGFRAVLTVASLLEKEVKTFQEKRIVADILRKRLKAGMPLQVDATLLYAKTLNLHQTLPKTGTKSPRQSASDIDPRSSASTLRGNSTIHPRLSASRVHNPVTEQDKKIDSPYNTYKYKGLPPTPICNPGLESIKAALDPADTNYWYYLSKPSGETVFSETYTEHIRKKRNFLP